MSALALRARFDGNRLSGLGERIGTGEVTQVDQSLRGASFGSALEADADELLRAAGRSAGGQSFEQEVLDRLDVIGRDVQAVKQALELKPQ